MFKLSIRSSGNKAFICTHKHDQALRVYKKLKDRKAEVKLKNTKTRSLIIIDIH